MYSEKESMSNKYSSLYAAVRKCNLYIIWVRRGAVFGIRKYRYIKKCIKIMQRPEDCE